jgi:hypothetical protein
MAKEAEVQEQISRLYEDESLTDELNDEEATLLLEWGEASLNRLMFTDSIDPDAFGTSLRHMLRRINRYVGKRSYEDEVGEAEAMADMLAWLEKNGFSVTEAQLRAGFPDDPADMMGTLQAILSLLPPPTPPMSKPAPLPPASPLPLPPLPIATEDETPLPPADPPAGTSNPLSKLIGDIQDWLQSNADSDTQDPSDNPEKE